jgi:hypothetical protein
MATTTMMTRTGSRFVGTRLQFEEEEARIIGMLTRINPYLVSAYKAARTGWLLDSRRSRPVPKA